MSTVPPALVMKRALPPVAVPVKLVVAKFSVVMAALPAEAEPAKLSEPLLEIVDVPAVAEVLNERKPVAAL